MRYDGPASGIDILSSLTVDDSGNIYVTGRSAGIGTGQDYATLKYSSFGQQILELRYSKSNTSWDEANSLFVDNFRDIYVTGTSIGSGLTTIKYNEFGDTLWVGNYNSPNGAEGYVIKIDNSLNIYVGGVVWNGGTGADIAVVKYAADGSELWSRFFRGDSSFDNRLVDLEVDSAGNVYVAGVCTNQQFDDVFYSDFITLSINGSGVERWRNYFSVTESSNDLPIRMELDHSENIVVAGSSNGFSGGEDFVVVKYSKSGAENWFQIYEGSSSDEDIPTDLVLDIEDNIIVTGYSWRESESFNFSTVKYDSSGNELWISEYNGASNKRDFAHAVDVDSMNNVYVTGGSREGMLDDSECVTVKYDAYGNQIWVISYSDSASSSNTGMAIAIDNDQNVCIAAHSVGIQSGSDYLIIKYNQGVLGVPIPENYPQHYELAQNYPNPFNPSTTINYSLQAQQHVQITVYDELGRMVRSLVNENKAPGKYSVYWDGTNSDGSMVTSGMYFYVLRTRENGIIVKKMTLLK